MMKDCKYNDFSVRFLSDTEELRAGGYATAIFHEGSFIRENIFGKSTNQIVFNANLYNQFLGNFDKFIIIENGIQLSLLWTSFKGAHEKINLRGGTRQLFDYLFLSFTKKKHKCLYFGNCVDAPLAAWRNQVSLDVISQKNIVDEFLKNTVETYLPF